MKTLFRWTLAALLAGTLAACNDDDDDRIFVTPTPTPGPTASPTPSPTPGTGEDGDSTDVEADDDGQPTPTPTPTAGGSTGAAMTATQEAVEVVDILTGRDATRVLYVERENGEAWAFEVVGLPDVSVGDTALFESEEFVFGDPEGAIIVPFPDGVRYAIATVRRLR